MSRKWIIIGLLVGLLLLGLYFLFFKRAAKFASVGKLAPQTAVAPLQPPVPPARQAPPLPVLPVPPGVVVPPEVARNPPALAYFLSVMTPITFYGKVVDEKGEPIEGATATISVADKMFENGSTYTKITDQEGRFSLISLHGLGLGVRVSKEGYYELPKSTGQYGYAPGVGSDGPRPTRDQPAVFVLRKKGMGVKLLVEAFNGHLSKDGTPVDVDLEVGKIVAPGTGNFRMELWSSYNEEEPNKPYDWKYQISVPGGGLLERTDDLAFEAPSDGYQLFDQASFKVGQDHYLRDLDKQYFVKLADGKYARITLSISRGFNILAYINPTPGDRNLEPVSK